VLELKIEAVAPGGREGGREGDLVLPNLVMVPGLRLLAVITVLGVDVEESEIAFAKRDEVPLGPEVGVEVLDLPAFLRHGEDQRRGLAGERGVGVEGDLVTIR
jgi:hypothetical protein